MTFPWKRVKKNTRISELLSNQIHQRRKGGGSPLVVETGFPTSLVDLFVKNKERLKRRSKKNKEPCPSPPPTPPLDNVEIERRNDDSSRSLTLSSSWASPSASPFHHHHYPRDGARDINDGIGGRGGERECEREGKGEEGVDANRVLVAILRMFMVVVLLLGTKKFVVGITMSAFLLVFLEYVGKHVCIVFRPCTGVKEKLGLIMKCRKGDVEIADNEIQQEESSSLSCSGLKNHDQDQGMSNLTGEIECCLVPGDEEIECEKERVDDGISTNFGEGKEGQEMDSEKVVLQEEGNRCETGELSTRKSRRARIKLKMKELVPKRLRTKRRKGRGLENEASDVAADNVATCEEEVYPKGNPRELRIESDSSMSREMDDGNDTLDTRCDQLVEINTVDTISLKDEERKTEQNSECVVLEETKTMQNSGYVVLVLAVLVGLIGGRILALVLTLACCLMQKSGYRLKQYIKAPFLRTPVKESS